MQLQVLLDTPGLLIGYDAENEWLYVDWKGEYDLVSTRVACGLMLDVLRAHPCPKILNDNSSISQTTIRLTAWSMAWLEEMRVAGLWVIAWVLPRRAESLRDAESFVQVIDRPQVVTFDDLASAYVWLRQQPIRPE